MSYADLRVCPPAWAGEKDVGFSASYTGESFTTYAPGFSGDDTIGEVDSEDSFSSFEDDDADWEDVEDVPPTPQERWAQSQEYAETMQGLEALDPHMEPYMVGREVYYRVSGSIVGSRANRVTVCHSDAVDLLRIYHNLQILVEDQPDVAADLVHVLHSADMVAERFMESRGCPPINGDSSVEEAFLTKMKDVNPHGVVDRVVCDIVPTNPHKFADHCGRRFTGVRPVLKDHELSFSSSIAQCILNSQLQLPAFRSWYQEGTRSNLVTFSTLGRKARRISYRLGPSQLRRFIYNTGCTRIIDPECNPWLSAGFEKPVSFNDFMAMPQSIDRGVVSRFFVRGYNLFKKSFQVSPNPLGVGYPLQPIRADSPVYIRRSLSLAKSKIDNRVAPRPTTSTGYPLLK